MKRSFWLWAGLTLGPAFFGCTLAADGNSLSEGCPEGMKDCYGTCVSTSDELYGCGRASCSPCNLRHAVSACSAEGECVIASCIGSWEDCDRLSDTGCEINIDTDEENCGGCGELCEEPDDGEAACAEAQCYVRSCEAPHFDCNFDLRDGCEVDLSQNRMHCGQCDEKCAADEDCVDGSCVLPE